MVNGPYFFRITSVITSLYMLFRHDRSKKPAIVDVSISSTLNAVKFCVHAFLYLIPLFTTSSLYKFFSYGRLIRPVMVRCLRFIFFCPSVFETNMRNAKVPKVYREKYSNSLIFHSEFIMMVVPFI